MDTTSRQKVNKEMAALNKTPDQMNIGDLYRTFHSNAAEYTVFQVHMEHYQE